MAEFTREGNGYIISKSIAKSTAAMKKWIIERKGYKYNYNKTFKVKSKIIT